ncbi:amidase family protein [Streptomyces sp. NPDC050315]|uniref:amidase n=1 Tax=Streptomyces sp. NPDC050315 TaxID=3155039 RepID=UPI003430D230
MDDYLSHDAVGLAQLVRSGEVKPAELLEAARARAAEVNPRINAIIAEFEPPDVEETPDAPFVGVPFLLKDLHQDLVGHPTSDGCRALVSAAPSVNATVVQRWLGAGLTVFGKTNTPEFGAKGVTEPVLFGPTRNPWNLAHTPGGSSGGAAAAVAAGIVPCAAASDGGGSIRIPASACGLFGLKPSRGLVPAGPAVGESLGGTATNGVVSRSVRDTAVMLDVLRGSTAEAPYLGAQPGRALAEEVRRPPGRLRIGICTASAINSRPHPEALAAAAHAADVLSELGHDVEWLEQAPYDDAALARMFLTTWFAYMAYAVDDAKRRTGADNSGFEPDTLVMAALGRAIRPVELIRAMEHRQVHVMRLAEFHASYDLLLTPTTATPPPLIGALTPSVAVQRAQKAVLRARAGGLLRFTPLVDQLISDNLGWVPYAQLANITGRPAMSVPLHWSGEGLPLGVQFVGRLGADGQMLRLAAQLEHAQPWAQRRPAV